MLSFPKIFTLLSIVHDNTHNTNWETAKWCGNVWSSPIKYALYLYGIYHIFGFLPYMSPYFLWMPYIAIFLPNSKKQVKKWWVLVIVSTPKSIFRPRKPPMATFEKIWHLKPIFLYRIFYPPGCEVFFWKKLCQKSKFSLKKWDLSHFSAKKKIRHIFVFERYYNAIYLI